MDYEFTPFPRTARLHRFAIITEKIDGSNCRIIFQEDGTLLTASKSKLITPENDYKGFSKWAHLHREELFTGLGYGEHSGEWWGSGIGRGYGLTKGEKRFSLFNAIRWAEVGSPLVSYQVSSVADPVTPSFAPACCKVVPVLCYGTFGTSYTDPDVAMRVLQEHGSYAAPGFMHPEGIVIYHTDAQAAFKKTFDQDHLPKGLAGGQTKPTP